jgi:hypothetical protein
VIAPREGGTLRTGRVGGRERLSAGRREITRHAIVTRMGGDGSNNREGEPAPGATRLERDRRQAGTPCCRRKSVRNIDPLCLMPAMARATRANPASAPAAERMPAWIEPQLAALVKAAPAGDAWLHEIKLDGYRMHARLEDGAVRLLTRRGNDWTGKYPAIAPPVASLPARAAYLDS